MEDQLEHTREGTSSSLTDTLVNRRPQNGRGPHLSTVFSDSANKSPIANSSSASSSQAPAVKHEIVSVPPDHEHRTLILCFDGTGEEFNPDNSNIVQLVALLKKDDKSKQVVYYQAGIGTYHAGHIVGRISKSIWKLLDLMFAFDLDAHIKAGYEFLMQTYKAGDEICLFGFSRGAHTARSLAAMIQKVGLLSANNVQQVRFAYKMFTKVDYAGWQESNAFKKAFSVHVDSIKFIGVWDTVESVGLWPMRLPFASSPTMIRFFRHALSLDERRVKFKATPWNRPTTHDQKLGIRRVPGHSWVKNSAVEDQHTNEIEFMPSHDKEAKTQPTDVLEVWFAGCHCDVGGGSVDNHTRNALARIPLRWMIRECFKTNSGILFDAEALRHDIGLDPSNLYPVVVDRPRALAPGDTPIQDIPPSPPLISRLKGKLFRPPVSDESDDVSIKPPMGTEEEEDLKDTLSPIYDELDSSPFYRVLEYLPMKIRYQRGDDSWAEPYVRNKGKFRVIQGQKKYGLNIHRSVQIRMDAIPSPKGKKYAIGPTTGVEPTWID